MEFDCVIVGGGLVGITFALMLQQLNYQVLVVEKSLPPDPQEDFHARTIALSHASQQIFSQLGIGPKLLARTVPIKKVWVTVKGHLGSSQLQSHYPNIPDLGCVAGFYELENILYEVFLQQAPQGVLRPATLGDIVSCPDGWHLTLLGETNLPKIHTRLLVAADGMHSALRQLLQIPVQRYEYNHFALMTNVQLKGRHPFTAVERFLRQGAIALLPWREPYQTCVWTVGAQEKMALQGLTEAAFLKACQEQLGMRYGQLTACSARVCVPLQMQIATQQIAHRFLLLGNAAHSLHPIAAQGLNLSLRDIWQIRTQLLKKSERADLGAPYFLNEYLANRKSDQQRIVFATDKIARFMSGGPLPPALRAAGMTIFDCLTPLKTAFTHYSLGLS